MKGVKKLFLLISVIVIGFLAGFTNESEWFINWILCLNWDDTIFRSGPTKLISVSHVTTEIEGSGVAVLKFEIEIEESSGEGSGEGSGMKESYLEFAENVIKVSNSVEIEKVTVGMVKEVPFFFDKEAPDTETIELFSTTTDADISSTLKDKDVLKISTEPISSTTDFDRSTTLTEEDVLVRPTDATIISPLKNLTPFTEISEENFITLVPNTSSTNLSNLTTTEQNIKTLSEPTTEKIIATTPPTFHVVYHEPSSHNSEEKSDVFEVVYHETKSLKKSKAAPKAGKNGKNKSKKSRKRKNKSMETTIDPFAETTTTVTANPEENDIEIVKFEFNIQEDEETTLGPEPV